MTEKEHKRRHIKLHRELDELVADYISCTEKSLSKSFILDLIEWSYQQTKNPESVKSIFKYYE